VGLTLDKVVDKAKPEPFYTQIANWIVQQIDTGKWPAHYKLPSEDDLARELNVSRGTVRKAWEQLIAAGRLVRVRGKGTFVAATKQIEEPLAEHLLAFSEGLLRQNIPFRTEVLEQRIQAPSQEVAAFLHLKPGEPVFYLRRRRFVREEPIILTENYVKLSLTPGIEREDFTKLRLFECLETRYGLRLDWARRTFEACAATAEQARLFGIAECAPLMRIEQIVYLEDGRSVEYSNVWLRGDRFKLPAIVSRNAAWTAIYKD